MTSCFMAPNAFQLRSAQENLLCVFGEVSVAQFLLKGEKSLKFLSALRRSGRRAAYKWECMSDRYFRPSCLQHSQEQRASTELSTGQVVSDTSPFVVPWDG